MPLAPEKPTFVRRVMPWIGVVLLAMGSLQTGLMIRGGTRGGGFQGIIAALGLTAAGAGLIQRGTRSLGARFAFLGAGAAIGAAIALSIHHR